MLYQETYHAGGDPHKLNVSGVIYMHDFTPPPTTLDSDPGLAFPSHCHLFYEIDYTLAGTCQFEFDGRLVNAMPGSLIFHPPLSVHSIRNDKRRGHLILQFSHKLLSLLDNSQEGVLLPENCSNRESFNCGKAQPPGNVCKSCWRMYHASLCLCPPGQMKLPNTLFLKTCG